MAESNFDATQLLAAYARGERSFPRQSLAGANLRGAILRDCNFYDANFTGADLSGADLRRANLSRANLTYSNLTSANLREANLSEAYLYQADLTNADTTDVVTDRPTSPIQQPVAKPLLEIEVKPSLLSIDTSFCVNCGTALRAEDKFCPRCGTARPESATPPTMDAKQGASQEQATSTAPQRPSDAVQTRASNANSRAGSTAKPVTRGPTGKTGLTASDWIVGILALVTGGWRLVIGAATVIVVVIGGIAVIQNVFSPPLSEHSSCEQFYQADFDAQTKVLQDMLVAHHDPNPSVDLPLTRLSVNLYCNVEGPNAPIDGVYSGGSVGKQPAEALHVQVPAMASVSSSQAWHLVAAKP